MRCQPERKPAMTDASPASPPFRLPADLGLDAAAPLREALLAAALPDVDGSAVATVSTAAIQVLLAAMRQAEAHGRPIRLATPSDALAQAIDDLGLAPLFALAGDPS